MGENENCRIWSTPASILPLTGDLEILDSPRAGGKYSISRLTTIGKLGSCDKRLKARLTSWLIEQRKLGEQCPKITIETIEEAKQRRDLPVRERADRLLRYFAQLEPHVGGRFFSFQRPDAEGNSSVLNMLAWSECRSNKQVEELEFLDQYLQNQGWTVVFKSGQCHLTVDGHAHLEELERAGTDSSQAFVAMWFDDSMKAVRKEGIEPAIKNAGYKPMVIDQKEHVNKIDDEIIAEIRRSRFVIADFTHGDKGARGSVYYEAGFARGLNLPVVFTCRKNALKQVQFDTRQYNHIVWETPEDLRSQLAKRIAAVMGDGPYKDRDAQ